MPDHERAPSIEDERLAESNTLNSRKRELRFGSKILAKIGFDRRHEKIVNSTFLKARKQGEKLPGKNSERRNYSYLSRIENLIDKYGNPAEQKLWQMSVDRLIIAPQDIPASYWRSMEQNFRDNGNAHKIDDQEKQSIIEDIQIGQKESLKSWSDYLGDKDSPYPTWFKIYAWDGVSKMGIFDNKKQQFSVRSRNTVAPYPKLNPAVLTKVYNTVAKDYDKNSEDSKIYDLVKSGNFNKLYSTALLNQKTILKTPEKTEDIHGEWVEYFPGDEEKISSAAEGTPWCVTDTRVCHNYLEYGHYSDEDEDDDDDEQEPKENKAKFILFHLRDPETNTLSKSACASIRINPEGNVSEISGINDGQAVEDSLLPIVEQKVRSLPGGEKYLQAFADKKHLIVLDRKMKENKPLTKDELEFLYEINRPIANLDTHNPVDPRVRSLQKKYDVKYALDAGLDLKRLISRLTPGRIAGNMNTLVEDYHADVNELIKDFSPEDMARYLNILIKYKKDIDVNEIASKLGPAQKVYYLSELGSNGANIDIDDLVSRIHPGRIADNISNLLKYGANVDQIVARLRPEDVARHSDILIRHHADIRAIMNKINELQ